MGAQEAAPQEEAQAPQALAADVLDAAGRTTAARSEPEGGGGDPMVQGVFGQAQAERLLWRAGFGPRPGDVDHFARWASTRPSTSWSTRRAEQLNGPAPVDDDGNPLAPEDLWGHAHCWWLDRMVRSDQPLVERMALIFHDWFATSQRHGRTTDADARPERAVPRARRSARSATCCATSRRPGDAAVPQRDRQPQGRRRTRTTPAR